MRPAPRPCRAEEQTMSRAFVMAAVVLLWACDPPPTAIPPGPGHQVRPARTERPLPPPTAEPVDPPEVVVPGADAGAPEATPSEPATGTTSPAPGAVGASCSSANDCQTGICEGEGCGEDKGVCMARNRPCTRDRRAYCGCDGRTFQASGSCPGQRFASRGACSR
jgi:hypothetical protein